MKKIRIIMDGGREYDVERASVEDLIEELTMEIGQSYTQARVLKNFIIPIREDERVWINPSHISCIETM